MKDKETIVVDQTIYIPDGAEEIVYAKEIQSEDESAELTLSGLSFGVPTTFIVVSQTLREAPDGTQVVDVVAETDDLPGVDTVEIRYTQA